MKLLVLWLQQLLVHTKRRYSKVYGSLNCSNGSSCQRRPPDDAEEEAGHKGTIRGDRCPSFVQRKESTSRKGLPCPPSEWSYHHRPGEVGTHPTESRGSTVGDLRGHGLKNALSSPSGCTYLSGASLGIRFYMDMGYN